MLHIVRMLERRFPQHARWFAPVLVLVSLLVLVAGVSLYFAP